MKKSLSYFKLFALQHLLFRFYNLSCRTARCAQPSVPEVNLICTNIFMPKVLRKHNFVFNHNTFKELYHKNIKYYFNLYSIDSKSDRKGLMFCNLIKK